jgi:hypothetical protein
MADLKKLIGNALNKAKTSKPSDDGRKGYNYNAPASTKTPKPEALGGYKKQVATTPPVKPKKQSFKEKHEEHMSMIKTAREGLNKMTSDLSKVDKQRQRERKLGGFTPSTGKEIGENQKESLKYRKY